MLPLPVDSIVPDIVATLAQRRSAVIVAPPGSGKTTRVPPALVESCGTVVVLQPRRVAARLAAKRIADERGWRLGGPVGYATRFERKTSRETTLEFVTEGLLLRRLQSDPFLDGVGAVILDEIHERSLDGDLVLALLREVQRDVRDDLRVVAMSATLDPGPVAQFLDAAVFEAAGRTFPVDLRFLPRESERWIEEQAASAVRRMLADEPEGHVLVFLPTVRSIERTRADLEGSDLGEVDVLPLHGSLPAREQDRALDPSARRKVVLATNIAETSVTLEGARVVIDSGMALVPRFDAGSGVTTLERQRIARDAADQRAGRAGRTGPGVCLRLWTEAEDRLLAGSTVPEVRRADLAPTALQLRVWGVEPEAFGWFERPPPGALERADHLLRLLGAVDDGGVTELGRAMVSVPAHPRLARVLLEGAARGVEASAATAAALVEGRDIVGRDWRPGPDEDDLSCRLRLVAESELGRAGRGVRRSALGEVRKVRDQLLRVVDRGERLAADSSLVTDAAPPLVAALVAGYPDRVALRRGKSERYLLASGSGAKLGRDSAARGEELVLALRLEGSGEPWIRLALALQQDWLRTEERDGVGFDPQREAVVARRVVTFGELVLEEHPSRSKADPLEVAAKLAEAAADRVEALVSLDADANAMLGRVATLRAVGEDLPDLSDLRVLLPALCAGRRSFAELRKASVAEAVRETLTWKQRQRLDDLAPERMGLPSGSTTRIQYQRDGSPPVLAARIQQLFGMRETPRVAGGKVALLVHLLAPNGRPAQVTQDLGSFWTNTWSEVRKDLRGRYPKHHWPEDPTDAVATDRAKRRR